MLIFFIHAMQSLLQRSLKSSCLPLKGPEHQNLLPISSHSLHGGACSDPSTVNKFHLSNDLRVLVLKNTIQLQDILCLLAFHLFRHLNPCPLPSSQNYQALCPYGACSARAVTWPGQHSPPYV